ncbi:hypothetical protein BCR33DRAFT_732990 [Rhizoclosmatium globosum]|uniref:Uncharacterized protein n=1 Tax=Rhizoclosmatium globosum TaxID=329046 RepID=A0A1Y2D1S8_9FUNG|nr:hypothetical protein BCR33DRAFT_732990 [Rhizoclosmatium globosum]|eukprot:ORY53241.1 hypothetical protein BCR33DRAFT_732990 [Rhizoclosmatium globosum]
MADGELSEGMALKAKVDKGPSFPDFVVEERERQLSPHTGSSATSSHKRTAQTSPKHTSLTTSTAIEARRGSQKWAVTFEKPESLKTHGELRPKSARGSISVADRAMLLNGAGRNPSAISAQNSRQTSFMTDVSSLASQSGAENGAKVTKGRRSSSANAARAAPWRPRLLDMQEKAERDKELLCIYELLEAKRKEYHDGVVSDIMEKSQKARMRRYELEAKHAENVKHEEEIKKQKRDEAISKIRQRADKYTLTKRHKKDTRNFKQYPEDTSVPPPAHRKLSFIGVANVVAAVISMSRRGSGNAKENGENGETGTDGVARQASDTFLENVSALPVQPLPHPPLISRPSSSNGPNWVVTKPSVAKRSSVLKSKPETPKESLIQEVKPDDQIDETEKIQTEAVEENVQLLSKVKPVRPPVKGLARSNKQVYKPQGMGKVGAGRRGRHSVILKPPQWEKHHEKYTTMAEAALRRKNLSLKTMRLTGHKPPHHRHHLQDVIPPITPTPGDESMRTPTTASNQVRSRTMSNTNQTLSGTSLFNSMPSTSSGAAFSSRLFSGSEKNEVVPKVQEHSLPQQTIPPKSTINEVMDLPPKPSSSASRAKSPLSRHVSLPVTSVPSTPPLLRSASHASVPNVEVPVAPTEKYSRLIQSAGASESAHSSNKAPTTPMTPMRAQSLIQDSIKGRRRRISRPVFCDKLNASIIIANPTLKKTASFADVADAVIDGRYEEAEIDLTKVRQTINPVERPGSGAASKLVNAIKRTSSLIHNAALAATVKGTLGDPVIAAAKGTNNLNGLANNSTIEQAQRHHPLYHEIPAFVEPVEPTIPEAAELDSPPKRKRHYIPLKMDDLFHPETNRVIVPKDIQQNDFEIPDDEGFVAPHVKEGRLHKVSKWRNTVYF